MKEMAPLPGNAVAQSEKYFTTPGFWHNEQNVQNGGWKYFPTIMYILFILSEIFLA